MLLLPDLLVALLVRCLNYDFGVLDLKYSLASFLKSCLGFSYMSAYRIGESSSAVASNFFRESNIP